MATNGSRGAAAERLVRDYLQGQGFYVMRSAGSKSPVDLIAVPLGNQFEVSFTRLIQVKSVARRTLPKKCGIVGFLNRRSMQFQLKEFQKLRLSPDIFKRIAVVVHGRPNNEIFFFNENGLQGL